MNSPFRSTFVSLMVLFQTMPVFCMFDGKQPVQIEVVSVPQIDLDRAAEKVSEALKKIDFNETAEKAKEALSKVIEGSSDSLRQVVEKSADSLGEGFGNALSNDKLGADFGRGAGGLAKNMGRGFDEFNQKFESTVTRGMEGFATNLGKGADSFDESASRNLFPRMGEISRKTFGTVFNWHNMVQIGLPIAGILALAVTGYYGTKFLWAYVQHKTINPKPKVLLPGSKVGWYDRWKRYWAGYKTPAMIFIEAIKARLYEIVEKTKNIKKHIKAGLKATYDNLLLYGEPGTGKTLFATILADLTDMDFAATTAGALLQQGAGVKYLNELIEMAERSRYGVILFIDEADALFVDRSLLDPASEHYQVLNHLLALTGDGSSKFMLIAATNHAYVMDEAMGRRFQDRVHMPLPDAATRKQIIDLYVETVLYNVKNNGGDFVKEIKKLLTKTVIQNLVEETEGLSNAEIKDIIGAIYKKSLATASGLPTLTIITSALEEGLEKKRALLEDRAQREAHAVVA